MVGTKTAACTRGRSKAERSSIVEVLEGRAAAAFSQSANNNEEKTINRKQKKDKKDRVRVPTNILGLIEGIRALQEMSMEEKMKKDFHKDHSA